MAENEPLTISSAEARGIEHRDFANLLQKLADGTITPAEFKRLQVYKDNALANELTRDGSQPKPKRITVAAKHAIIQKVIDMLGSGVPRRKIVIYLSENHQCSERSAQYFVAEAKRYNVEAAMESAETERPEALGRLRLMYQWSMEDRDIGKAILAHDRICQLMGVAQPTQANLTISGDQDRPLQVVENFVLNLPDNGTEHGRNPTEPDPEAAGE